MLMASLRDPYAGVGVGMLASGLAASQLAQLNHLMMQQHGQPMGHGQSLGQPPQPHGHPTQPHSHPTQPHSPPQPSMSGAPPECQSPPISRTYTYKKVTKPLLERKRRARINRCLDELKELMVGALEAEGENVSKLEKADILELTVRHLQRITKPRDAAEDASRFQAGFSQCASEACHFLLGLPGLDAGVGRRLVAHLSQVVTGLGPSLAGTLAGMGLRPTAYSPPASPDLLLTRQNQNQHPALGASTSPSPSRSSQLSPSGPASPEVSSTSWVAAAAVTSKRSFERSEAEDSDEDPDSDAPVNYTSEALSRQQPQQRKRPRLDPDPNGQPNQPGQPHGQPHGQVPGSSTSVAISSAMSYVSSSAASHSGSDDEDKGPMWRPW